MIDAHRTNRHRPGFTLLELLTVMAIISILISVLLPAMSGARRSSRDTKCQANVWELCKATKMYVQRNEDRFPVAAQCGSGNACAWNGHQYFGWQGTRQAPLGNWYRPVNRDLGMEANVTNPSIAEICECPSDIGAVGETGTQEKIYTVLGSSYVLNPILAQGKFGIWKYRNKDVGETEVFQPSEKVLITDHVGFGVTFDVSWSGINPGWHDQSRPSAIFGYVDGHAVVEKGRCKVREWQWYPEATGPAWVEHLAEKVDWSIYEGCE